MMNLSLDIRDHICHVQFRLVTSEHRCRLHLGWGRTSSQYIKCNNRAFGLCMPHHPHPHSLWFHDCSVHCNGRTAWDYQLTQDNRPLYKHQCYINVLVGPTTWNTARYRKQESGLSVIKKLLQIQLKILNFQIFLLVGCKVRHVSAGLITVMSSMYTFLWTRRLP